MTDGRRRDRTGLVLVEPPQPMKNVRWLSTSRDHAVIREEELAGYMKRHPDFTRQEILHAIVRAGPLRTRVEAELLLTAARKAAARF